MTVQANNTISRTVIAGTGPYAFNFRIFDETDLAVCVDTGAIDPVSLTLPGDYTVAGVDDEDGGTVTLTSDAAALYAGSTLDIRSNTAETQPTSIRNQGSFLAEIHEDAFDRLARQVQDLRRAVNACFRYPDDGIADGSMGARSTWAGTYVTVNDEGVLTPTVLANPAALTQSILAQLLNPQNSVEQAAGATVVNPLYPFGNPKRYATNTVPGTTDMTDAVQKCLDMKRLILPAETLLCTSSVTIENSGTYISGESKEFSVLKFSAVVTKGLTTPNYARADGDAITYITDLTLENFSVDITAMPDGDSTCGILIEDSYANRISNITVTDPLEETSNRWGLRIGRAVYTTSVSDSSIGRRDLRGSSTVANFTTTIKFYNCDAWHQRIRYCQDIGFYGDTIQKDDDKYDIDFSAYITIIGGDYESGGNFIRCTTANSVSEVQTMGNAFGGFTGTMFGGAAGRPLASVFMDEFAPMGSRVISSLTRSGTTATAVVITTLGNGIFKSQAPPVGTYITVAGSDEANFNRNAIVLTSDAGTNTFTYAVANTGATTSAGSPTVTPDDSVGSRYARLFDKALAFDSIAPRTLIGKRMVLPNNKEIAGFLADGETELRLIYVDTSGNLRLGDGTVTDWVSSSGHLRLPVAGKGLILTNPGNTQTKTITLNSAGNGFDFT